MSHEYEMSQLTTAALARIHTRPVVTVCVARLVRDCDRTHEYEMVLLAFTACARIHTEAIVTLCLAQLVRGCDMTRS